MLPTLIEASHQAFIESASPFDLNKAPVIGILTQTLPDVLLADPRFAGKTSYMM